MFHLNMSDILNIYSISPQNASEFVLNGHIREAGTCSLGRDKSIGKQLAWKSIPGPDSSLHVSQTVIETPPWGSHLGQNGVQADPRQAG